MALVVSNLKATIKGLLADMSERTDKDVAADEFAGRLATAIDGYIRSATITVTGTCPSEACTGTGTIS